MEPGRVIAPVAGGEMLTREQPGASRAPERTLGRPRASTGSGIQWSVLGAIAAGKVTVLAVVAAAYSLLPFFSAMFRINFVDPNHQEVTLATAFSTWDAQHYLFLSESGYHAGQMSNAFFPLFPLLIHVLTPLFGGSSVVAGLVVANACSLVGVYVLYRLITALHGSATGRLGLLLYLAFPTAFFFSLVYSESLFLLLVSSFFYALLVKRRPDLAAIPAALLPLARPEGTLILIPFAVWWWRERRGTAYVAAPFLGAAAYLLFMYLATGNPLEMIDAMTMYVSAHSVTYLLHPLQLAQMLGEWPLAVHGYTNSAIDRLVFLGFVLLIWPMAKRLHPALLFYAFAVGLLNPLSGTFMSYSRYVLLAFPAFVVAADLLCKPRLRWLRTALPVCLAMGQGLFVTMQALSYWVG